MVQRLIPKTIRPIELAVLITFLNSCTGISFDPYYALPNMNEEALVHRDGKTVPFSSNEMLNYACMTEEKVRELAELLQDANMKNVSEDVKNIFWAIRRNQ